MTLDTLEHRNITEIDGVLKRSVGPVTRVALTIRETTEIHRMLKRSGSGILLGRTRRIVKHRVADVAIISYYLAGAADVFAIMTAETTCGSQVTDVIRMGLPIGFHLGKEIDLIEALHFGDRSVN